MKQAAMNFSTLTKDLILATATKEQNCSQEELYFALNCLLRSFHSALQEASLDLEDTNIEYIQTQFCCAYKIITGKTIYPFQ
ncbi:TPA: hypothetical protein QCY19_002146 [Bacillus luti]|nr:hypothetical protein [Bacillus luti]